MARATAAMRRYAWRTAAFMGGYIALNVAAVMDAFDDMGETARWALAAAVAAPVVGHMWATLALIRESDEFVRGLIVKRFIIAAGLAIAAGTSWGFAESFAGAPHVPGWAVYAAFWGFYGAVVPFVATSR